MCAILNNLDVDRYFLLNARAQQLCMLFVLKKTLKIWRRPFLTSGKLPYFRNFSTNDNERCLALANENQGQTIDMGAFLRVENRPGQIYIAN